MLHNNNKAFGDIPEHTNKRKGITMALTACYSIVQNMLTPSHWSIVHCLM